VQLIAGVVNGRGFDDAANTLLATATSRAGGASLQLPSPPGYS
jgi:hypothetical protein